MSERNPQARHMADESMVRNLAAQAEAIWPQEAPLVQRYALRGSPLLLDVACGTGEISRRLLDQMPAAKLVGVDLIEEHLERARAATSHQGGRASFELGDAFHLRFEDRSFDLTVCRHLLQAIPDHTRVLAELARVTRPGGTLHIVAEDYAMMHFDPVRRDGIGLDTDLFWHRGPIQYAAATGSDLRSGRKIFGDLRRLGLTGVRVDYITVDTVRVPREIFARIWRAWRDGYAESIAAHTTLSLGEVLASFEQMIEAIEDPDGYAVWHLPVVSGQIPSDS